MSLNERQIMLLAELRQTGRGRVDVLANRLRVSRRTVYRDVKELDAILETRGAKLEVDGSGVVVLRTLSASGLSAVDTLLSAHDKGHSPISSRVRWMVLGAELLLNNGPLKTAYFARRFHVTEASISSDLNKLEPWLYARGLALIRRRGYGLEIAGPERSKRQALVSLIHELRPLYEWVWAYRTGDTLTTRGYGPLLSRLFDAGALGTLEQVLREELASADPPLDDAAFYGFLLHLRLSVERLREGCTLEDVGPQTLQGSWEYGVVARILGRLSDGAIPSQEIEYLARHLRGARSRWGDGSRVQPVKVAIVQLAYRLAQRVSEEVGVNISRDEHLIFALAQHLDAAISRMSLGLEIRNPLLNQVIEQYPALFHAVANAAETVFREYGFHVPDEEIGYLTMHVGAAVERLCTPRIRARVVCPNGMSSAHLLAQRLQQEFPHIEVTDVSSVEDGDDAKVDIVISTVPLPNTDVPWISVSPFLNPGDVRRLDAALRRLQVTSYLLLPSDPQRSAQLTSSVHKLLSGFTVQHLEGQTCEDVIHEIGRHVARLRRCNDVAVVEAALLAREQMGSVVLPGARLALLHARCDSMRMPHIGVYRLSSPLSMTSVGLSEEPVETILVMLARTHEEPDIIAIMGKISAALVVDESLVDALHGCSLPDLQTKLEEIFSGADDE